MKDNKNLLKGADQGKWSDQQTISQQCHWKKFEDGTVFGKKFEHRHLDTTKLVWILEHDKKYSREFKIIAFPPKKLTSKIGLDVF